MWILKRRKSGGDETLEIAVEESYFLLALFREEYF